MHIDQETNELQLMGSSRQLELCISDFIQAYRHKKFLGNIPGYIDQKCSLFFTIFEYQKREIYITVHLSSLIFALIFVLKSYLKLLHQLVHPLLHQLYKILHQFTISYDNLAISQSRINTVFSAFSSTLITFYHGM